MRHKYDTAVVFLYAIGKENMLPYEFRKQIPSSTISTWRKTNYSEYLGHEFRYFFDDAFKNAEIGFKYLKLKKTMLALTRAWVMLSYTLVPLIKSAAGDKVLQARVLNAINYIKSFVGLKRALKIVGISTPMYYQWILEARFDCFDSFTHLCVKRHPQQLQLNEILKIKKMLTNPEYDHWPIVSIAGVALRQRKAIVSLYSWYKYAKFLNISKKVPGKSRKTIGIIASKPNEYLHVDTTFYELITGKKISISFVMDNYSKMILGWHVSERNNFQIVINSVSKALKNIEQHPDQKHSYLVTDGGSENHNKYVNEFIERIAKRKKFKFTKIRALKDIRFSNSPVEAIHRTMKSRYLRGRKFESIKALVKYLEWAVNDYNIERPHYKHRPRTPHEVYFNIPLKFDVKKRVKQAIRTRIKNNKNAKCIQCTGCKPGACENKF